MDNFLDVQHSQIFYHLLLISDIDQIGTTSLYVMLYN